METEIKLLDIDKDKFIDKIEHLGAMFVKKTFQKNTIYENEELKKTKTFVRIREEEKHTYLTVKGPKKDSSHFKIREEKEITKFEKEIVSLKAFPISTTLVQGVVEIAQGVSDR